MQRIDSQSRGVGLVLVALAIAGLAAIAVHRHLFADGAYYLLVVTAQRDVIRFVTTRLFVHEICEVPMLWVAARPGATWAAVSWTFGASLILGPLAVWALALFELDDRPELRRTWCLALLWLGVLSGLYAISEIHWAAALFLWAIAMLGREGPLGLRRSVLLPIVMFAALRAYESYALLGPLLALEAAFRMRTRSRDRSLHSARGSIETIALLAVVVLGLLQAGIAVREVIAPRDPHNRTGAILGPLMLPTAPTLWWLGLLMFLRWERFGQRARLAAVAFAATGVALTLRWPVLLSVRTQTDARSLNLWIPLVLGLARARSVAAIAATRWVPRALARGLERVRAYRPGDAAWAGTVVFALGVSLSGSWAWHRWSDALARKLSAAPPGAIAIERDLRAPFYVGWSGWSLESASVAVQLVDIRAPRLVGPPGTPIGVRAAAVDPEASFRPPLPP